VPVVPFATYCLLTMLFVESDLLLAGSIKAAQISACGQRNTPNTPIKPAWFA
jgi:hypothetical protein